MEHFNFDSGAISREVVVQNRQGLHLRPAAKIVKAMATMNCDVKIRKDNKVANAKSIMSVTTLIATKGTVLTIEANGPDAALAVASLVQLFDKKFHED
jgi:phosphocarrier protein HPr